MLQTALRRWTRRQNAESPILGAQHKTHVENIFPHQSSPVILGLQTCDIVEICVAHFRNIKDYGSIMGMFLKKMKKIGAPRNGGYHI